MDLDRRVGKEIQRDKYNAYNQLDKIQEAMVVYAGNTPIGAGAIRRYSGTEAEIKRMFVRPEYQGRGIGTELVRLLLGWPEELVSHRYHPRCEIQCDTVQHS